MEITAKPFEALDAAKQADGLIPAIIQDARTLRVLMLGYMNREAYEKSLSEGRVTFYSRTRRRLWTKGETSGNYLDIVSVTADCDNDTPSYAPSPTARPATPGRQAVSTGPPPGRKVSSATYRASSKGAMPRCPRAPTRANSSTAA